jgi:DNA (cytosine-5)-methyltransferase 1
MINLATVFSGIGAIEQAFKQLEIDYHIQFACDNGERYIDDIYPDDIERINQLEFPKREAEILKLYNRIGKENQVKKSYFSNYDIDDSRWHEDIRFVNGNKYSHKVDLLVGGSPCQSFSTYGKRMGLEDTRGTLFYDYARLIKEIRPKFFIFENVTGLLNHDGGKTWNVISAVFESLEYHISSEILDAKNYGIPQMRKRLFVVGVRNDLTTKKYVFPKPIILDKKVENYLVQSIESKYYLPKKGFAYVTDKTRNEGRARCNRKIIGCQTANQQFNWTGDFRVEEPKKEHYSDKRIFIGEYEGKPAVARKLTPLECLNLMGFQNFKIVVSDQVIYRQVGNSIAVTVLMYIINELLDQYKESI